MSQHTLRMPVCRVGQNHICTVYIWYFWQKIHQIYGHIRCIYVHGSGQPYLCGCGNGKDRQHGTFCKEHGQLLSLYMINAGHLHITALMYSPTGEGWQMEWGQM